MKSSNYSLVPSLLAKNSILLLTIAKKQCKTFISNQDFQYNLVNFQYIFTQ